MKDVREVQAVVDGLMYGACDRLEDYHSKRDGENAIKWFREGLNSSHGYISYAVFCLKKKKKSGEKRQQRNTAGE